IRVQYLRTADLPASFREILIHHHMSTDDLRRVFQVESHDQVPEYEVVHVHSLTKRGVRTDDDDSKLRRLKLKAFGRDVHLTLQRTDGLFKDGELKMWVVEPNITQPHEVEYRDLPQYCRTGSNDLNPNNTAFPLQ
ncbi:hypothetical protein L9F63_019563, partial [Diploptera punctata]